MFLPARLSSRLWIIAPLIALGFLVWSGNTRARRVELVTRAVEATATVDRNSPTGYANGLRVLIAPGHNNESYQWIAQTQQMIAEGNWRLRHVDYDNAPNGRPVTSPSPYRWWLASVAAIDHLFSDRSIGLAVERAALWADPILHILLLVSAVTFTCVRFGALPAALLSLGLAMLFPFAGGFVAGSPDSRNLTNFALFASVMTLVAGLFAARSSSSSARRWFLVSGAIGGGVLWISVSAVPVLIGLGLGAFGAAWLNRRDAAAPVLPWRTWSIGGAIATVGAYLLEYAPAHMGLSSFRLSEVHPLYAVAWLGGGELLARANLWMRGSRPRRRDKAVVAAALLALIAVPAAMLLTRNLGFLAPDTFASRLTLLDGGIEAENLVAWIKREGFSLRTAATFLPLALLGVAGWMLWHKDENCTQRSAVALVVGPVLVTLGLGCWQLSWWNQLDLMLLVLLVVASTGPGPVPGKYRRIGGWTAGAMAALVPGLLALIPARTNASEAAVTRVELVGLVERDLAHWLARRAGPGGAIVLAPPSLTTSLYFHGGLRGLGSPYRENEEGFRASIRIAGATSADEAQALATRRKLTHIVIPSWDGFLDEYARLGANEPQHSLMGLLHNWLPPRWLRPVSFQLPNAPGFENEYVVIFEVTELQDNGTALSRLTEYFLEMGRIKIALAASQSLASSHSSDLGALVARAQVAIAQGDRAELSKLLETIIGQVDQPEDSLPWDRRVSLCIVLAQGGKITLARAQAERCLDEMSASDLRGLTTLALYRFLTLCKALDLELRDPAFKSLARELLPPEMRTDIAL